MRWLSVLAACSVVSSSPGNAFAQGSTVLNVPGGLGREQLGAAVDIQGDTLVAGAPRDDENGFDAGAAYVFVRTGTDWTVQAQVVGTDTTDEDLFGSAVHLDRDRLIVGAPHSTAAALSSGAAYVFERVGAVWTQTAKLEAGDGSQADRFGFAVALEGDRAVVGAPRVDGFQTDIGAVYVFERVGTAWVETARLTALDAGLRHQLGTSVSIDGDRIASGAPRAMGAVDNTGAAYLFERGLSGWSQAAKAYPPDGTTGDYLGRSLELDGDRLVVGAPGEDRAIDGSGKIFVFERSGSGWSETGSMTEGVPSANARLGLSVALEGELVFSGAPHPSRRGRALAFGENAGTWAEQRRFRAGAGTTNRHRFGSSVAVHGTTLAVGMPGDDGLGTDSGAVHLFDVVGVDPKYAFLESTISVPDASGVNLGRSVALSGDTAFAVAPVGTSTVYVSQRAGGVWASPTSLFESVDKLMDVDVDGDTAALVHDTHLLALVYVRSGAAWTLQTTVLGHSKVAVSGDLIVLGGVGSGVDVYARVGSDWTWDHSINGAFTDLDVDGYNIVIVSNDGNLSFENSS